MKGNGSLADAVDVPGPWEHRRIAANGARFHVATLGDGPLVLLLHGFPEFWWAWRDQLPSLAAAGWRMAAMDLRGYGGSDKTPQGYDPATLTADVTGVVRSLGERQAVLVGHGWGAYVAWATAVMRPAHVAALATLSMPHPLELRRYLLRGRRQAGYLLGVQAPAVPERRLVADDAAYVETLLRRWVGNGSTFPDAEAAARYRAAMRLWPAPHCALEYHRWAVRSLARADGRRFALRMQEPITVPVLQVHGGADRTLLPRAAVRSGRHVAGPHRWVQLEGVGHFPHEEAPDRVTAELLDWLGELAAAH
ncbi:MAG TPA: alpha/beta hydrolase [Jiangellaceae bacterium]|nr:alpha/beta hydrolase [Jiangellaceae bacterium]